MSLKVAGQDIFRGGVKLGALFGLALKPEVKRIFTRDMTSCEKAFK